ncbi:hypothetical protein [Escherichia coli]|uniref:hypothetical protein n=1 Tax=Escherichia coli TaxID=562 RepID=UPI0018834F60|nr:hypothetical protein [Escherichia coli]MBE9720839.1 hypothetical protein [Escherichia coli]
MASFSALFITACDNPTHINKNIVISSGNERSVEFRVADYTISDTNVASINNGKITAKNPGKSTIVLTDKSKNTLTINLTVKPFKLLSIGNSHTWDLKPSNDLVKLAKFNGVTIDNEWHIYCNHNIENIISSPEVTCVDPKKMRYRDAINNVAFDAITIQPFMHGEVTDEVSAVESLIKEIRNSKSKDAAIYIYYTWSRNDSSDLDAMDYTTIWNGSVEENGKLVNNGKVFQEYLQMQLAKDGVNVSGLISESDLLERFDRLAKAGKIDGFSGAGELYRDNLHMTNIGRFIIARQYLHSIFNMEEVKYAPGTYLPGQSPERDRLIPDSILSMGVF